MKPNDAIPFPGKPVTDALVKSITSCTAVLISGQARTFAKKHCFQSQCWQFYAKLHNPWFFVSVADDADAEDMELLRTRFEHVYIERVKQPDLVVPAGWEAAAMHAPYGNSVPLVDWLKQYWHLQRVFAFCKESAPKDVRASVFVRMRPDSFIKDFEPVTRVEYEQVMVPWWGNYSGVNDRLAVIAGTNAAAIYFNTFDAMEQLVKDGCPAHPESLLAAWLRYCKVPVNQTLHCEFETRYPEGDPRPTRQPTYYAGDIFRYVQARLARPLLPPQPAARPAAR